MTLSNDKTVFMGFSRFSPSFAALIHDELSGLDERLNTMSDGVEGAVKTGTGAGYTIALVTTAFGAPASLPEDFIGFYINTVNSKTYLVRVVADVFVASELTVSTVPSGE